MSKKLTLSRTGENISQHSNLGDKTTKEKVIIPLNYFSTYSNTPIVFITHFKTLSHGVSSEGMQVHEEICLQVLSNILSVV